MPAIYSPLQHEHITSPTSPCFVVPCRAVSAFCLMLEFYTHTRPR